MTQHDHETLAEQYIPSSSEHVRDQVALYEATGGREGGTLEGVPVVVLTMTGATSGKIRKRQLYVSSMTAATSPSPPTVARRATPPGTTI
jgi:hypothetical protein